MKNIICLVGQLGNGGTEKQLGLFLKNLDHSRYRAQVVVSSPGDAQWGGYIRDALSVGTHFLRGRLSPLKLAHFWLLKADLEADIVFSWSYYCNAYSLACGKTKFVGSLRQDLHEAKNFMSRHKWRLCLRRTPFFVVNSTMLRGQLEAEGVEASKIRYIPNIYVRRSYFEGGNSIRERLGVDPSKIVVGVIARATPEKDVPFFIDAAAMAMRHNPALHALIIGDGAGPCAAQLAESGLADRFTITGRVDNAAALLPAVDIYFLSSRTEGMPNVLLEAVDAGCSVVARDVGGVRDILAGLDSDSLEKILVTDREPNAAAAKLLTLAADPALRETLSASMQKGLEAFSPENVMPLYHDLLSSL